jgi:ketosteroid isomerase-like protein
MRPTTSLTTVFVTAAALLIACPSLHADPPADAKKAIQQNYNAMNAAMAKKDINATMSYFNPDFVQITQAGKQIRLAEMRSGLAEMTTQMKGFQATTVVSKVTLDGAGKTASATVRNTLKMTMVNPQTNKDARVVATEDSVDTWVKTTKGWRLKLSKTSKTTQTIDGKPVSQ